MQIKKKLVISASGIILSLAAAPTFAILSAPYGTYLEGNIGATKLSNKSYPGSSSTSTLGGNLNLGYKFMPYFAAELGYTRYGNTTIKNGGNKAGTDKHYSIDLAAKGITPITASGFEAFAKIGIQRLYSRVNIINSAAASGIGLGSNSHSATGLYLGLGGQYYFMPEFALNAQWARAIGTNTTGTLDLWSIGASYIFG